MRNWRSVDFADARREHAFRLDAEGRFLDEIASVLGTTNGGAAKMISTFARWEEWEKYLKERKKQCGEEDSRFWAGLEELPL